MAVDTDNSLDLEFENIILNYKRLLNERREFFFHIQDNNLKPLLYQRIFPFNKIQLSTFTRECPYDSHWRW